MLWGKPALLVQVTVSPLAMVIVAGSKTKAPADINLINRVR